jgi:hypothetical protein
VIGWQNNIISNKRSQMPGNLISALEAKDNKTYKLAN